MIRSLLLAVALLLAAGAALAAPAEAPDLLAVKFHADWCGSCEKLGDAVPKLADKLDGESVLLVELDLTNRTTRARAGMLAGALSLTAAWDEWGAKTGFILLVDPDSGAVVDRLTADLSVKEMGGRIKTALAAR